MKRAVTDTNHQAPTTNVTRKPSRKVNQEERPRSLVVRLTDEELQQLHALAAAEDREVSRVIRRWIREAHAKQFPVALAGNG